MWIGANATICGGVKIGEGSIIGAGNGVTKEIPAGVIAVENPCRVLRKITEQDIIDPLSFLDLTELKAKDASCPKGKKMDCERTIKIRSCEVKV